ncbi:MAG: hypothetical protein ACQESR_00205 [Planctomycetota bacterium]
MESRSTQAVLPLVGLAANKVIRDRYNEAGDMERPRALPDTPILYTILPLERRLQRTGPPLAKRFRWST